MSATRNTIQRTLVLDAVRELGNHPTPDDVYRHITLAHPNVSRSTVYRNLNLLCQSGQLLRIQVPDGAEHIDHNTFPHFHCICRVCSQVMDIPADENISSPLLPADNEFFSFENSYLVFSGVCSRCNNKAFKH